jgi:hypothetical protein
MQTGRTGPALFSCSSSDDDEDVDYVVKTIGGCDFGTGQLVRELAAAQLADFFGLAHPKQALVEIGDDLAALMAYQQPERAESIRQSIGINFGSQMLNNLVTWPVDRKPSASQHGQACAIFAFDMLIRNPDRKFNNPNLGVVGDQIFIFDHELAFSSQYEFPRNTEPWRIANDDSCTKHVFFNQLRHQIIEVEDFFERLSKFPVDFFDSLQDEIPTNWDGDTLIFIKHHINLMAEHSEQFCEELLRRLA